MPAVIESTFQSLLNDNFDDAYKKINNVRIMTTLITFLLLNYLLGYLLGS